MLFVSLGYFPECDPSVRCWDSIGRYHPCLRFQYVTKVWTSTKWIDSKYDKITKSIEYILPPPVYSNETEYIKYITPAWPPDVVKTIYHCVLAFLSCFVSNHNYEQTMIFYGFPPAWTICRTGSVWSSLHLMICLRTLRKGRTGFLREPYLGEQGKVY